ncbi:MAG: SOS response-associated peptidase, partial [Bacteroidota bacterium]
EEQLEKRFHATFYAETLDDQQPLPNFNIAPTHYHPVITSADPEHFQYFRWGLVPFWAKDPSIGSRMINARMETVLEKPAFRAAIRQRRCLVPFDGFYEWKKMGKQKFPYRIRLKDDALFAVAGIWEKWQAPDGSPPLYTFSILTQPPNPLLADIHDRMPAILRPEQEAIWLDEDLRAEDVLALISPYAEEEMDAYPVSKRVNKVGQNDASLLSPVSPPDVGQQGSLF